MPLPASLCYDHGRIKGQYYVLGRLGACLIIGPRGPDLMGKGIGYVTYSD